MERLGHHELRTIEKEQLISNYTKLADEARNVENKNHSLKSILRDTIEIIDNIVIAVRAIIYVTTIGYLWYFLAQKEVAIGVTIALVFSHLTVAAREALANKKHQLDKV